MPQDRQGFFQTNVDGQSVTLTVCCAQNQPRYSRDSIAEFQLTTNRFDATQGRTMGMMVNAITKSGTNTFAGTFGGYFRRDNWNAEDFIQKKVLPYKDTQVSGTFGGPIVKDRVHFFGNYEYERNPQTFTFGGPNGPFPTAGNEHQPEPGREVQRAAGWREGGRAVQPAEPAHRPLQPLQEPAAGHAAAANTHAIRRRRARTTASSISTSRTYTSVLSNNTINEIKGGLNANYYTLEPIAGLGHRPAAAVRRTRTRFCSTCSRGREIEGGAPAITFSGYTIGSPTNNPQRTGEHNYQIRDDFTTAFELGGRHDVKMGGDFIKYTMAQGWCNVCDGQFTSNVAAAGQPRAAAARTGATRRPGTGPRCRRCSAITT